MFSTMVLFLFHCDSLGFAAARMDVRAFNWQMIPALAMLNVCCSITYKIKYYCAGCMRTHNSNVQHTTRNQKVGLTGSQDVQFVNETTHNDATCKM